MKVFVCLVNYGSEQIEYLKKVVIELKNFKKYEVFITVNTTVELDIPEIDQVNIFDNSMGVMLPLTCRNEIWENRENYDLFIYGENDHLFKEHHLDKFVEYSNILPIDRIAGLFQYEENENGKWYPAYHAHFDWDYSSVEVYDSKIFAHFTNIHQASFILTKTHLEYIGKIFDFTTYLQTPSVYDAICRVNTDIYMCGLKKLICISEFDQNIIHHLPNLYINGDKGRIKLGCDDEKMNESIKKLKEIK